MHTALRSIPSYYNLKLGVCGVMVYKFSAEAAFRKLTIGGPYLLVCCAVPTTKALVFQLAGYPGIAKHLFSVKGPLSLCLAERKLDLLAVLLFQAGPVSHSIRETCLFNNLYSLANHMQVHTS